MTSTTRPDELVTDVAEMLYRMDPDDAARAISDVYDEVDDIRTKTLLTMIAAASALQQQGGHEAAEVLVRHFATML